MVSKFFRYGVVLCVDSKSIVVCSAEIMCRSRTALGTVREIVYRSQNNSLDCSWD